MWGDKRTDEERNEEFIKSPVTGEDIKDMQWLIDHGTQDIYDSEYRLITVVGLKKLINHFTALGEL